MLEAQVGQLLAGGLAELRDDLPAPGRKGLARTPQVGVELLEFGIQPAQLGIALLQALQFAASFLTESDDLGQRGAVFALERMNQIEALFELLEACGIEFSLVGIVRKLRLQLMQHSYGLLVQRDQRSRRRIHPLQFLQRPADGASLGK